uniref:Uncharacterized protein n=1 Tax=Sinocyclocheilus anshuiensis TaxID=1608454 RepID=A0A671MKC5_9TELE
SRTVAYWWCFACSDLLFNCALGLPKQDSGHWWSSFFFGKQNQPGMGTLTEEAQQNADAFIIADAVANFRFHNKGCSGGEC